MDGKAQGHIQYTPQGRVSATLMQTQRKPLDFDRLGSVSLNLKLTKDSEAALTDREMKSVLLYYQAGTGYVNYSGTYRVDGAQVHHVIETSFMPQWVGTTLSRSWAFSEEDRCLTLTATSDDAIDKLVWLRS